MAELTKEEALKALEGMKIPILPIDHNWHQLFLEGDKTESMIELEKKINELVKHQSAINSELNQLRKEKKQTMASIVTNMHEAEEEEESGNMHERSVTMDSINEQIASIEDELLDLPYRIDELNKELMAETMVSCFERMHSNVDKIAEINDWITEMKNELKRRIIRKQNLEVVDRNMFTYLEWMFKDNVYGLFDIKKEDDSDEDGSFHEKNPKTKNQ